MLVKLDIPDDLAKRLGLSEDRLAAVLSLGLDALETHEGSASVELPASWQAAIRALASRRRRHQEAALPAPAALIAYARGALDRESREALAEHLSLRPDASRELLDLLSFDRLEPPSAACRLSPRDLAAARQRLQTRLAAGETRPSRWNSTKRLSLLPVALILLLALGILGFPGFRKLGSTSLPRQAPVIDLLGASAGQRFDVSARVREVLLLLPRIELEAEGRGSVEISTAAGDVVYRDRWRPPPDSESRLYLTLPRGRLADGDYRIAFYRLRSGERQLLREQHFTVRSAGGP